MPDAPQCSANMAETAGLTASRPVLFTRFATPLHSSPLLLFQSINALELGYTWVVFNNDINGYGLCVTSMKQCSRGIPKGLM